MNLNPNRPDNPILTASLPLRISTIDILRAFTMLLMIFVNDLWSLKDIPAWLEHTRANDDGMGLADTVFPAFLVIVGMSVPFSINNRSKKGDSTSTIILHILFRSLALLVMGLFLVNGENINESGSAMPRFLWNSLACLAFIFIWNAYPPSVNRKIIIALKIIGWIMLLMLAWIYRGGDDGSFRFDTWWWGILGLIGWAYLVSALVYNAFRNNITALIIFFLFCVALCLCAHSGIIPSDSLLRTLIAPFGEGAMPAFVTAGMLTASLFIRFQKNTNSVKLLGTLMLISGILTAAGFLLRPYWGISKILATPSWVLICSGITIAFFCLIYWLADLNHKAHWFDSIKPAGTNTLLCYLLPYFAYALIYGVFHFQYPENISTGIIGLFKSFVFAFLIIQLTGLLGKAGIRLKL